VQVANAIANVKNVEPVELESQLQHHVPTDAIQHLVDHQNDEWEPELETPTHVELIDDNTVHVDPETS